MRWLELSNQYIFYNVNTWEEDNETITSRTIIPSMTRPERQVPCTVCSPHFQNQTNRFNVVGHDWGSVVASHLYLFQPDRVIALVNLSVPYQPHDPTRNPKKAAICADFRKLEEQKRNSQGMIIQKL